MTGNRLNLVDFAHTGHHAEYLRHLVGAWPDYRGEGMGLRVTVTPEFADAHPALTRSWAEQETQGVELHVLDARTADRLARAERPERMPVAWLSGDGPPATIFGRAAWDLAQQSASEFGADRLVFMEIDTIMPALAAHLPAACEVSGIWFKPPRQDGPASERDWVLHQGILLKRALSHPALRRLLCLDEATTAQLQARLGSAGLTHLPDPVAIPSPIGPVARMELRRRFDISEERRALLFFGQLAARKGLPEILAAVEALAPSLATRLSLLIAGPPLDLDLDELRSKLEKLRQRGVQARLWPDFVAESLAGDLFRACDAVLAVYRNHVGMSGVMLRAAAHGRPVLSQSYGLMGELCRRHRLGLTVDGPGGLGAAVAAAIDGRLGDHFDPPGAAAFVGRHSVEAFCRVFYSALGLSSPSLAATAGQSSPA